MVVVVHFGLGISQGQLQALYGDLNWLSSLSMDLAVARPFLTSQLGLGSSDMMPDQLSFWFYHHD